MWSQTKDVSGAKTAPTPPAPAGSSATRKWVRESFKRNSQTRLPRIENLMDPLKGLRSIPIAPIEGLDGYNLRALNHGHKNLRLEALRQGSDTASRPETASVTTETTVTQKDTEGKNKKVTFPVPEQWKRKSFLGIPKEKKPSLTVMDLLLEQQKAQEAAEEAKVKRSRDGFMTAETGIGTGRGNSPIYKAGADNSSPHIRFAVCLNSYFF